jgi:adenylate cyclase
MTDIILASGGTIDKYEGDAIIAFWNAPLDLENHAQAALEAAVKCQSKLDAMRPELEKRAGQVFLMRIGINTGEAVVGNMGSHSRFDYSMLGDSVNLAARLEGFNKQFDSYTMCSEATKNAAQRHGCRLRFRELGKAAVVGKSQAVRVFEPMTEAAYEDKKQSIDIFEKALKAFYDGDFLAAKKLFASIAATDPPAKKYLEKIIFYENNPLSEEEKKNWEGIWVATTK